MVPSCLAISRSEDADVSPMPDASVDGAPDTLSETLDAMARVVERKNPGLICSILLVDSKRERITVGAGPSLPPACNSAVEGLQIGPAVGSCGTDAYWNIPVIVEDIASDPLWKDLQGAAALADVAACWSQPILSFNGQVLGAMALYDRNPGAPTRSQMDGLEIAARMVGLAVERSRLEEQLRHAAKMEALGVLARGIAHDFNDLLAAVLGNAELALISLAGDAPQRGHLQEIVADSGGATELCNQLLAYAGRGARTVEPLECNALAQELGGLLQVAVPKKASLEYELAQEPLVVVADRSQLRQVLMNLITNAAEAIGNHSGRIVLSTAAVRLRAGEVIPGGPSLPPGEYVCIAVSDTGCGMDAETRARNFDPFFTTKAHGRGLGLAAVQGIVAGHKGGIALDSRVGHGTRFCLYLPRAHVTAPPRSQPVTFSGASSGRRLLVVDDEPRVLAVQSALLESEGYFVARAADGAEAIESFRAAAGDFDCVLLDLSMPKLDGEKVFKELRALRPDVKVVLSSGFTEQEILDRFRGCGLAGVLQKPARSEALLSKVAEAIAACPASAGPATLQPG